MSTVIDLFSGAGGLSLGAARAGFSVRAAVETDPFAVEVHAKNFPHGKHLAVDVGTLTGTELLASASILPGGLDGLIGGPPCQGFSMIGRRQEGDLRNDLFGHFFRLVSEIQPAFFVAENVPGILDERYEPVRQAALAQVSQDYQILPPIRVSADRLGAPTTRTRIFFIGFKPNRFRHNLTEDDFIPTGPSFITTVGTALDGLPQEIDPKWQSEEQGWQPVNTVNENWFTSRLSGVIPNGVGHQPSLERYFSRNVVSGCMGTRHRDDVVRRFSETLPGKQDPISKAIRLRSNGFCPTLRAGTSKERGSYQAVRPIHHTQARVITAREAARLQGFPDWFVFHSTKWHSFRQIGNSVSPLVGEFVLAKIIGALHG
jgi:DNA (cytosine-5)-methyltransferase 1